MIRRRHLRQLRRGAVVAGWLAGAVAFIPPAVDWGRVWIGCGRPPVITDFMLQSAFIGCVVAPLAAAWFALSAWTRR